MVMRVTPCREVLMDVWIRLSVSKSTLAVA